MTAAAVYYSLWDSSGSGEGIIIEPAAGRSLAYGGQPAYGEAGTGWSSSDSAEQAVAEALKMALAGLRGRPDFVMLTANSGRHLSDALPALRRQAGRGVKIYGVTSDSRGFMTEKDFVAGDKAVGFAFSGQGPRKVLGVLAVRSARISFGVGAADSSVAGAREAAKLALAEAVKSAGAKAGELPEVALISPTYGEEEAALEGVRDFFPGKVTVFGGTSGGPDFGVSGQKMHRKGVSVALIYTELPVGYASEVGLQPRDIRSGVVTKVERRGKENYIREIGGKPAWKVYSGWLSGEPDRLFFDENREGLLNNYTALRPLFRKVKDSEGQIRYIYTHPLVSNEAVNSGSINTVQKFSVGERVYLTAGSWEGVLNTVGYSPAGALLSADIERPLFGVSYICAGLLGTIPEEERAKMPALAGKAMHGAPFLGVFAWGEQAYYPGVGAKHCNLTINFLAVGGGR